MDMSRTRYRQSFLDEVVRFERCNPCPAGSEPIGLRQFFDRESRGITPESGTPYFRRLLDGKKWWEWTLNEYADRYLTWEWWGWWQITKDFAGDLAGFRQACQRCGVDPQQVMRDVGVIHA